MSNTLAKDIAGRLRQQTGKDAGQVTVVGDHASITVDVEHSERYAVGVRGVTVRPYQPIGDVRDAAERISQNVSELDGDLAVVEFDARQGQAIVRSAQPDTDEAGVTYWEADVRADETTLRRYRKDHDAPDREAVTEPLMHNSIGRVVEQLVDATT